MWIVAASLAVSGCALPHSGERGGYEAYVIRFKVLDSETGEKLEDVKVEVRDGARSVAAIGRTDRYGEYTFRREYGRSRARAIRARAGYPTAFRVAFEREGWKKLLLTLPEREYRFGLREDMSVSRKEVTLERGAGTVFADER